jgi:acetylglutamate kinase
MSKELKIITAEEAKTMMRTKFNKREKRLINRCVRRATKRGYRYADFYESSFKVSHSELLTLFTELGYDIHFFRYSSDQPSFTIAW